MADNDSEKDRRLLENLDRVLAGKEDEIAEPLDDDTRTALDFASKMVSMHEVPSKEFKESLKAQLIHRLAEQEKKDLHGDQKLLLWGITRRKLWQGTIAAVIVVIIAVIILLITLYLHPAN